MRTDNFITAEFATTSSDGKTLTEYYNPKTRIAAVQGKVPGEVFYVWLADKPDTDSPNPEIYLVEWVPRSGKVTRQHRSENLPVTVDRVDGVGFLRPKIRTDDFLPDTTTTSMTDGSEPEGGPNQRTTIAGRKSMEPTARTGITMDKATGNVLIKGPKANAIKLTEGGIHQNKPVKTLEMKDRGWQSENFMADFLPSFPTYPAGLERLPNLPLMTQIFGKVGVVINAIRAVRNLLLSS